jgi:hypothetical protein
MGRFLGLLSELEGYMSKMSEDIAYVTGEILFWLTMTSIAVSVSGVVLALGWVIISEMLQWK